MIGMIIKQQQEQQNSRKPIMLPEQEEQKSQSTSSSSHLSSGTASTYYTILGVNQSASQQQIKRAYKRLVILCHPDKIKSSQQDCDLEKAVSDFRKLCEAYTTLSDVEKRKQYDLMLAYSNFTNNINYPDASPSMSQYEGNSNSHWKNDYGWLSNQQLFYKLFGNTSNNSHSGYNNSNSANNRDLEDLLNQLLDVKQQKPSYFMGQLPTVNNPISSFSSYDKIPSVNSYFQEPQTPSIVSSFYSGSVFNGTTSVPFSQVSTVPELRGNQTVSKSISTVTKTVNGVTATTRRITIKKRDGTKEIIQEMYDGVGNLQTKGYIA